MDVDEGVSPLFDRAVSILMDRWCLTPTRAVVALVTVARELDVRVADLVELVSAHEAQIELTGGDEPTSSAPTVSRRELPVVGQGAAGEASLAFESDRVPLSAGARAAPATGPVRGGVDAAGLSLVEAELLALIAAGASNSHIARELSMSHNSVRSHIRSVYRRIGVTDRVDAVVWGVEHGLVAMPTEPAAEHDGRPRGPRSR